MTTTSSTGSRPGVAHAVVFGSLSVISLATYGYYRYYRMAHRLVTAADEERANAVIDALDDPITGGGRDDWGEQEWCDQEIGRRWQAWLQANPTARGEDKKEARSAIEKDVQEAWWHRFRDQENEMPGDVVVVTESDHRGGAPKKVRVRRVQRKQGWRFVRWWVNWGKAEFPSAYRSKLKEADRTCIEHRLRAEMRKRSVRDADVAMYLPQVVVGIMTPSRREAEAERMLQTRAIQMRREEARPLGRIWDVLWGSSRDQPSA